MFDLLYLFFLLLALMVLILVAAYSVRYGITPMPSNRHLLRGLDQFAELPVKRIYELGSGWGTVAVKLAELFPEAEVQAIEISPIPISCARLRVRPNLKYLRRNIYETDLSDAELVYCYTETVSMQRLASKFKTELREGCYIISNTFALPGWEPVRVLQLKDIYRSRVYLYRK